MSSIGRTGNDFELIRHVDLTALLEEVHALFPDLRGMSRAELVGEGFGSYAVSIDACVILRVARNAETLARHRREAAILPLLRDRLPLAIPEPRWLCGPTKAFPFGLMGYPRLEGVPCKLGMARQVDLDRVARQLAEFLSALYAFPVDQALSVGVNPEEPDALVEGLLMALPAHLDGKTHDRFTQWWKDYRSRPERYAYTPALLHGDLWCENILLSPDLSHAVGVVDFEQVRIGDPVVEFAALRYLGAEFVDRVRAHYQPAEALEPNFEERLQAAILLRELGGLRYALRFPESGELEDAVKKVYDALAAESSPGE